MNGRGLAALARPLFIQNLDFLQEGSLILNDLLQ
jgi:hypothetical protein